MPMNPTEHVMEIGVGLDVVKLAAFNQRTQYGPSMAAPIAAGKEMILATERNWPDCAFNRIGIEFDAAIMQEARQSVPARERVADRFGNRAAAWYKRKLLFEPECQVGIGSYEHRPGERCFRGVSKREGARV